MTNLDPMKFIFEALDLSDQEMSILEQSARFAKQASSLARHTGIRPHSLPRILRRLEKRHLVVKSGRGRKLVHWRSNMAEILRAFRNEYLRQRRSAKTRQS
jgi:DNA-binding MarR family transcriptional regulator